MPCRRSWVRVPSSAWREAPLGGAFCCLSWNRHFADFLVSAHSCPFDCPVVGFQVRPGQPFAPSRRLRCPQALGSLYVGNRSGVTRQSVKLGTTYRRTMSARVNGVLVVQRHFPQYGDNAGSFGSDEPERDEAREQNDESPSPPIRRAGGEWSVASHLRRYASTQASSRHCIRTSATRRGAG